MAWGTINLGRMTVREDYTLTANGTDVTIAGQESSPPLTAQQLKDRQDNLTNMRGQVVPVTFTDKTDFDGYYAVKSVSTDYMDFDSAVLTSGWSITLVRLGTESEIEIESVLNGSPRSNDHGLTGQRWHSAAAGHYSYYTGSTTPSTVSRAGDGFSINTYTNVPTAVDPRWSIGPSNYLDGAAEIARADGRVFTGVNHSMDPTDWQVSNGLVRVSPNATNAGRFDVEHWDGAWRSKTYVLNDGSNLNSAWEAMAVLHNDPDECVIRLVRSATSAVGQVMVDLSLRRGSRSVHCYMQRHASATLKVARGTAEAATSGTGFIRATNNDAEGNRYVLGSSKSFTADTTNGAISKSSVTEFDFFISSEVHGSVAQAGDTASDLVTQYLGTPAESVRLIRR